MPQRRTGLHCGVLAPGPARGNRAFESCLDDLMFVSDLLRHLSLLGYALDEQLVEQEVFALMDRASRCMARLSWADVPSGPGGPPGAHGRVPFSAWPVTGQRGRPSTHKSSIDKLRRTQP